MRITGWDIHGFGELHDHEVTSLSPGLSVVLGPNGAGKTTLMAYIRGMLFGFPTGRSSEQRYRPVDGGRHGGRLFLTDTQGARYTIEREAGRRAPPIVLREGEPCGEHDLKELLARCSETSYRAVFAFDLDELSGLGHLTGGELGDQISSVGMTGAGRSPHSVLSDLTKGRDDLYRKRGRSRINHLEDDLRQTEEDLRQARSQADDYQSVLARLVAVNQRLEEQRWEIDQERERERRSTVLRELWADWAERTHAEQTAAESSFDQSVLALTPEIEALERGLDQYQEWITHQRDELRRVEDATANLTDTLSDLGPEWDRERLNRFDRSIPRREDVRGFGERSRDAAEALADARRLVDDAARRRDHEQHRHLERVEALAAEDHPATLDEVADMDRAVRRLRANLAELTKSHLRADQAAQRISTTEGMRRQSELSARPTEELMIFGAVGAAAVALGGMVWQSLAGNVALTAGLGVIMVAAVIIAWQLHQRAQPKRAAREHVAAEFAAGLEAARAAKASADEELRVLREHIATDSRALRLPDTPTSNDVEDADQRRMTQANARRDYDQAAEAIAATARHLDELHLEHDARHQDLAEKQAIVDQRAAEWAAWKREAEVPAALSPEGVSEFFEVVRVARDQAAALDDMETTLRQLNERIAVYDERVRRVTSGDDGPSKTDALTAHECVLTVQTLYQRLTEASATRDTHVRATAVIAACDQRIRERLGEGPWAESVLEQLPSGALDEWAAEVTTAQERIAALEHDREAAIRERTTAEHERDLIERSSDVPGLELRRATLMEEMATALREWRVLSLAGELIEQTRAIYERERQPKILQETSWHFQGVTSAHYQRIFRRFDDGASALTIEDAHGRHLTPDQLSRGTKEQLYLCVRLAYASAFAERQAALPILMDDVLVNFDPVRARAVAEMICHVAQRHQTLVFTCHPRTAELFQSLDSECARIDMESSVRSPQPLAVS